MKMKAVVLNGQVINIGEWGAEFLEENGDDEVLYPGEQANPPPPFPEGAIEGEFDIELTEDGRYVLSDNYAALRKAAYPEIGDQLDAIWKGGDDLEQMRQQVMSVKEQHPKPSGTE